MSSISQIFAASVPRYTSYPTAPHFHPGIDAAAYGRWLEALPPDMPLSLYVHVPFCDTLCWFCGCHTQVVNNYAPVEAYCALLEREIALVARHLGGRRPVRHIHWGGGSPTLLSPDSIRQLDGAIRARFDVRPDAEFSIEVDPRGLTQETAAALGKAGVTRASIGMQDCDPAVQRAINRIQTREETAAAARLLRAIGIGSLNIDLVYGLPLQTMARWKDTLDFTLSLDPDRLAVFGYAHVPGFKKHQALIRPEDLPGLETRHGQAELARAIFCANGYDPVGLDHFAKPEDALAMAARAGRLRRNFQGYTADDAPALIGLGASSISALPQGYVQNIAAVPAYRDALGREQLPVARGIALTDEDRARRHVIERLMCDLAADAGTASDLFGLPRDALDDAIAALDDLARQGLVTAEGRRVTVPDRWRTALRLVCAAFDAYLPGGAARHSIAI